MVYNYSTFFVISQYLDIKNISHTGRYFQIELILGASKVREGAVCFGHAVTLSKYDKKI